ncbi:MAG: AsmA family protein [Planctomycetes bacterium]|nr:AsmA family protein [Planctomycetota bacterium]
MKAKKIVKQVGIGLLVVILVIVLVVHFAGDAALKAGIETGASKALGVNVSVGKISFSILGGTVKIKDLVIDNPEGYQHPEMLKIGKGYVDVSVMSLLSDTIEIKTIKFDGIDMVVEQKGLTSNLNDVMKNLPSEDKPATKAPAEEKPAKEPKNLVISELEISNVTVKAKLLPIPGKTDTVTIKLAPIQMTDLGSDDKMSMSKLAGKILAAIATGVAQQGAGLLPKDMVGDINTVLKDKGALVFDKSKDVLEESKKIGEKALEGGKELGDALKGLFK